MEIGHEIISTAILSLPLIQVGQLSVTGERMCIKYWLTALGLSLPRKSVVGLIDHHGMTIVVDWDVKPQIKQVFLWQIIKITFKPDIVMHLSMFSPKGEGGGADTLGIRLPKQSMPSGI